MIMTYGSRWGSWLVVLTVLVGTATPVLAQGDAIPSISSSGDPALIKSQLRRAVQVGGEVIAGLQEQAIDEMVPLDPVVIRKAKETYALIRAGRHGFELHKEKNEGKKFALPDPIMDLAFKRVDTAWNLARYPLDYLNTKGISRQDYLHNSTESLGRALKLVNEALVLMP